MEKDKRKRNSLNPFAKGHKLYGILHHKCPRCQEGKLFLHPNPYNLKKIDKMPPKCMVCGKDFIRENGFFYGALMMSHAITTLIGITIHSIVYYFWGWKILPHILFLVSIVVILMPIIFRTARAIWISLFVSYQPEK